MTTMALQRQLQFQMPQLTMEPLVRVFEQVKGKVQKDMEDAMNLAGSMWRKTTETVGLASNAWRKSTDAMNRFITGIYLRTMKAEASTLKFPFNFNWKGIPLLSKVFDSLRNRLVETVKGIGEKIKTSYGALSSKLFDVGKSIGMTAIKGAAESEDMRAKYGVKYGGAQKSAEVFGALRGQALRNGTDVSKSLQSGLELSSISKNTGDILKMNEMVQRLSAFQENGGNPAETAGLMKDAYFGDSAGLLKQLNMPVSAPEQEKLELFSKTGDLSGFMQAFDTLMAKANMSQASLDMLMDSPIQKWEAAVNRFNGMLAAAGESALQIFAPVLDLLNQAFVEGKFDPFFASIQTGMMLLAEAASAVANFLVENWDLVQNALIVLGAIAAITAAAWLIQWIIAAWPLFAIVGVIVLILTALNQLGVSTETIVGTVIGLFSSLFTFIRNAVATIWNLMVSFAEFFVNLFIDPFYAIEKLIYDIAKSVIDFVGSTINSLVDGINWLIGKVNSLTGSKFEMVNKWSYDKIMEGREPKSDKDVVNLDHLRIKPEDMTEAFDKGKETYEKNKDFTKNFMPDTSKFMPGGKTDPWNGNGGTVPGTGSGTMPPMNIPKVGEVGKVGAIDNKVEITDENIEMMRDLAEMDAIQNFVSLTPTVQVNTGDIHQGFDMDTLINRIEKKLEEEFVSTAEGVYG